MNKQFRQGLLGAVCLSAIFAAPSWSQDTTESDANTQLEAEQSDSPIYRNETITVTAQRRESSLQDVPFSIAAYSGEALADEQINSPAALTAKIPGITIDTSDKSLSIVAIRGNVSTFRTATLDTPVAFFSDDIYYVFNNDLNTNFYDLNRVEVMRGPQGTLFGRNAVGGAIAVVTNDPKFEDDYFLELTGGNAGYARTEGMLNGVIKDDVLAGRIAFSTEHSDGQIDAPNQSGNFGSLDAHSARGKLLFTPNDVLEVLISADYSYSSGNGGPVEIAIGGDQTIPASFGEYYDEDWTNYTTKPNPFKQELRGGFIRGDLDLWGGSLTSITGYRINDSYSLLDNLPVGTDTPVFGLEQTVSNSSLTQEIRYASGPDRLSYVVGVYYLSADVTTLNGFDYSPLAGSIVGGIIPPNPTITNIQRYQHGEVTSAAIFGQIDFEITDQLSIAVGGRYTEDQKDIDYRATSETAGDNPIPVFSFPGTVVASGGTSWDAFTPRVTLTYEPTDDINLYATYAEGFKSGGFVDNAYNDPTLPLAPENAKNYELGIKSKLFDNRVDFNMSIFQQTTENLQNFSGAGGVAHTYNGTLEMQGIELESLFRITPEFDIGFNYAYLDGEYSELLDPLVNQDFSGNPAKFAPDHSLTLAGTYRHQLENAGMLTAQADFKYSSEISTDDADTLKLYPELYDDTVGKTLNARLNYESEDGRWKFSLWGKNLTNNYQISLADNVGAFLSRDASYWKVFTNQPRSIGVSISVRK